MKSFLLLLLACVCCQALDDQAWQLSGSVSSDIGPVKGVMVNLRSAEVEAPIWTKTDSRGEYHLSGTKPGQYTLAIQKKDNLPGVPPRTITLQAKQKLVLDIHVPRGSVLSGRVVDQDRQSIKSVLVRALVVGVDQSGIVKLSDRGGDITNDRGEFRIPYLERGKYVIAVTPKITSFEEHSSGQSQPAASATIQTSFYPSGFDVESATILDVNGQEISDLVIQAASRLSACISFTLGAGFSTGQVFGSVTPESLNNGPQLAVGQLMAKHSYRVCGLARGEYTLRLEDLVVQNRQLLMTAAQVESVDLSKGSVSKGTIEPAETAGVSGTVTLDTNSPGRGSLSSIVLMLNPVELYLPVIPKIHVQPDGTFSVPNIMLTEYRLSLSNLPPGYYVREASQRGRNVLDRGLRPGDGDVEITLDAHGPNVSGSVITTEEHNPVFDATVFVVPNDGTRPLHTQTDENGQYSFKSVLPPGTYRIAALSAVPEGQRDDPAFAVTASKNGKEVNLQPGQTTNLDIELSR
jgi:hypothetical protein